MHPDAERELAYPKLPWVQITDELIAAGHGTQDTDGVLVTYTQTTAAVAYLDKRGTDLRAEIVHLQFLHDAVLEVSDKLANAHNENILDKAPVSGEVN